MGFACAPLGAPIARAARRCAHPLRSPLPFSARVSSVPGRSQLTSRRAASGSQSSVVELRDLLRELSGVEVPGQEALLFLEKMPLAEGHEREEREQMVAALQAAMRNAETADVSGSATEAAKSALLQLWKWRRRGGGLREFDDVRVHEAALRDICGLDVATGAVKAAEEEPEKIQSALFDGTNLSDKEKVMMGEAVRGLMMGAVQSFLWNAIVLCVVFLLLINFVNR